MTSDADAYLKTLGRISRRERRERVTRAFDVIKRAQRAGLPVRSATVDGVRLEFGLPEAALAPSPHLANPWDIIYDEANQKRPS
jgi:hypothetical protein